VFFFFWGKELANLERRMPGSDIPNLLEPYSRFVELFKNPFALGSFEVDKESLSITLNSQSNYKLKIGPIPEEVLAFKVSGYVVIQQFLKSYTMSYLQRQFDRDDFQELLFLLQRISQQIVIVRGIDNYVKTILEGEVSLLIPEGRH